MNWTHEDVAHRTDSSGSLFGSPHCRKSASLLAVISNSSTQIVIPVKLTACSPLLEKHSKFSHHEVAQLLKRILGPYFTRLILSLISRTSELHDGNQREAKTSLWVSRFPKKWTTMTSPLVGPLFNKKIKKKKEKKSKWLFFFPQSHA